MGTGGAKVGFIFGTGYTMSCLSADDPAVFFPFAILPLSTVETVTSQEFLAPRSSDRNSWFGKLRRKSRR